jgi:hypothetical protein
MMRSWDNRGDCHVSDEPLCVHYLNETGLDHPGREETLAALSADLEERIKTRTGSMPNRFDNELKGDRTLRRSVNQCWPNANGSMLRCTLTVCDWREGLLLLFGNDSFFDHLLHE